jgi:hypothetical protein
VVDAVLPPSAGTLHQIIVATWPRLTGRVRFGAARIEDVPLSSGDVVVSCHACGALTDVVLDRAADARARVAVLPCCHDHERGDTGGLAGWMPADLAIDTARAARLRARDYRIVTRTIPAEVTPRNRLLIGIPGQSSRAARPGD